MDLAKAIGSTAIVLGIVVAAGFAVGEHNVPAPTAKQPAQEPLKIKGPAGGTGPGVPEGSGGA